MDKKDLVEQLRYSSSKWLYVVTWNNLLKQLYCPFRASVLGDIGQLRAGQVVLVDEVKVTAKMKTVFMIEDRAYYYYHFDIIIE